MPLPGYQLVTVVIHNMFPVCYYLHLGIKIMLICECFIYGPYIAPDVCICQAISQRLTKIIHHYFFCQEPVAQRHLEVLCIHARAQRDGGWRAELKSWSSPLNFGGCQKFLTISIRQRKSNQTEAGIGNDGKEMKTKFAISLGNLPNCGMILGSCCWTDMPKASLLLFLSIGVVYYNWCRTNARFLRGNFGGLYLIERVFIYVSTMWKHTHGVSPDAMVLFMTLCLTSVCHGNPAIDCEAIEYLSNKSKARFLPQNMATKVCRTWSGG